MSGKESIFCKSFMYNKSKFSPVPCTAQYLSVCDEKLTSAFARNLNIGRVKELLLSDRDGRIKFLNNAQFSGKQATTWKDTLHIGYVLRRGVVKIITE